MTFETIKIARDERGVATITLARPKVGNSLNQTMLRELVESLSMLAADGAVRVLVLRAEGRHFCAGMDLGHQPGEVIDRKRSILDLRETLVEVTKPIVAVVEGAAVGGGAALACCCDIVIATDAGYFSIPESRLGIMPLPLMPLFDAALGARQARRYLLTGEKITALRAEQLGLAHERCSPDALASVLSGIVDGLLLGSPAVTEGMKTVWRRQALAVYAPPDGIDTHADRAEGIAAFKDKRRPAWYRPAIAET